MENIELRTRLEALAYRTAPPPQDVDDLVATVAERHSAGRRRQWLLAAAAAVVVAVLVTAPGVLSGLDRDSDPASPATPTGVYTTPTRGISSDDENFVEGMRRLAWTDDSAGDDALEPPLETRHVVWAGLVAGEQWVLVAGADPDRPLPPDDDGDGRRDLDREDRIAIAWFAGPHDGIAQEMTLVAGPRVVDAQEPAALTDSSTGGIIVAAPGDTVEVSHGVRMEPDGTPRRVYEVVPDFEGVTILALRPDISTLDRSLGYRVIRDGKERTGPFDTYPNPGFTLPDIEFDQLRAAPPPAPGDRATTAAIDELFGRTGYRAEDVRSFTILWAGAMATGDGGSSRLTVLAVELPDGPFYVTGAMGRTVGGQLSSSTCGSEVRPGDTRPGEMVVVLRCGPDGGPGDAPTDSLVVVAPVGATTARALDDRGEQIASYPLVDGVTVVPIPENLATVAVVGADGETIDERAPMGEVDWGP